MDHLDPCRRDPDCAQWPPWQELGLVAWEEATVDRVDRGRDFAVHRGLVRPYLSFQNGRRSSQAQALCPQRAREESLTGVALSSLGPALRPHRAELGVIFISPLSPVHGGQCVAPPSLGVSWLLRGSEGRRYPGHTPGGSVLARPGWVRRAQSPCSC